MVKVEGPMMSFAASGTLGKIATFSNWKGRKYVRSRVIPANPKSGGQVGVRSMLKFLSQFWTRMSSTKQATWEDRADVKVISPFNAYIGYNLARWRNYLTPSLDDPAEEAEAAPGAPTTTPADGPRQITLSIAQGAPAGDLGVVIHRSQTTGFTPAFANCIAVIPDLGEDPVIYVDTPLAIGTYYYRILMFMGDGKKGALEAEVSDTVV